MKVFVELQYVHTGECFEQDGFIGIKTDEKKRKRKNILQGRMVV